jgi:hypothetical protein
MNLEKVKQLVEELSGAGSDKKLIYKQLVKLRVEVIKDNAGIELFRICSGLEKLIKILEKPNPQILEVGLSILGNCCMSEKCRKEAFEKGIVSIVIPSLSLQNKHILSRSCRLIGNLAINPKIGEALQESGAAFALNNVLDDNEKNSQISSMAIRAVNKLYGIKKFREDFISYEMLVKIMVILSELLKPEENSEVAEDLIQPYSNTVILRRQNEPDRTITKEKLAGIIRELEKTKVEIDYEIISKPERSSFEKDFKLPTEKDSLELIQTILKCLQVITTSIHPEIARQMYGNGYGYTNLIFLSLEKCKFRSLALKVLSNLSSNTWAQGFLSSNDLILHASQLLIDNRIDSNEQNYCVNIVCLSAENACNRNKIRRSGVLKTLLEIARTTVCIKQLGMVSFS